MHMHFASVLVFVPTASHCSDDRVIDAGGSVTNAIPTPELLREIRENPEPILFRQLEKST